MKLNVKRSLFFVVLALGIALVGLFRLPLQFQSSLHDLFPIQINGVDLPKEVTEKYFNLLNVIVEADSFEIAKEKSDEFYGQLKAHDISDITYRVPQNVLSQSLNFLKEHPNSFLSPDMRDLLLNAQTEKIRDNAVNKIQTSWMPPIVPLQKDPFLLLTDYIQNMPKPVSSWSEKDGVLWQEKDGKNYIFMLIKVNNADVHELLYQVHLIQQLSTQISNCQIHLSGAPIHTAQMFEKTKFDISLISCLAILGLIVLTWLLFRHIGSIFLVISNLSIAFICGILSVFLFSSKVHFLTFAFGASLVGICIDYSFHRFYCQDKRDYSEFTKNISSSFLTTVSCFIPLLFSGIPLLYQIALFTIGGLCGTFLWIFVTPLPILKSTPNSFFQFRGIPFRVFWGSCLVIVSIVGLFQVHMDHSSQNLYKPSPLLQQEEAFFHRLNEKSFSYLLLIYGKDLQSILEQEEKIKEKEDFFSLSTLLPSLKRQKQQIEFIENLYHKESKKIQFDLGLKQRPVFKQIPLIDEVDFRNQFDFLIQQFIVKTPNGLWGIIPLTKSVEVFDEKSFVFAPSEYLSNQLDLYAAKSYQNLFISFCFLFLILCLIYHKNAFKYAFPSLLACMGSLGFLSLCGQGITFFHLLSLFVVIGLGMDYTIFLFGTRNASKTVLFSFISSFIGFGLLSFVHFYMVSIMGQTIALGLFLSFLFTLLIKKD